MSNVIQFDFKSAASKKKSEEEQYFVGLKEATAELISLSIDPYFKRKEDGYLNINPEYGYDLTDLFFERYELTKDDDGWNKATGLADQIILKFRHDLMANLTEIRGFGNKQLFDEACEYAEEIGSKNLFGAFEQIGDDVFFSMITRQLYEQSYTE